MATEISQSQPLSNQVETKRFFMCAVSKLNCYQYGMYLVNNLCYQDGCYDGDCHLELILDQVAITFFHQRAAYCNIGRDSHAKLICAIS